MNNDALRPQNTQNARSVGVDAFKRFLEVEGVGLDYVFDCMAKDPNGRCLAAVMDKFAMHLAFREGVNQKQLAKNTVMSYFRHVKNWLLGLFPDSLAAIDVRLREMGRILEKYMNKRESEGMTKHARACTKKDLALLVSYLCSHATTSTDYQDAALVSILWYVFGRASDVSICSNKNFFVRLVRVKTSEQQGLSLHADADATTCPILALALPLVMQSAPCPQLLENIRPTVTKLDDEALASLPLSELLAQAEQPLPAPVAPTATNTAAKAGKSGGLPGIHNKINRLLALISKPAGIQWPLSSHSFRRGGAQHANSEAGMSMQWISDRGGWNLSSTHKVWSYVFNTTQEDQRISKVLSGWKAYEEVPLERLDMLDAEVETRVRLLQSLLFNTCIGMQDPRHNMCPEVVDACASRLLRSLPELSALNPNGPVIQRIDACAAQAGIRCDELLRWAVALEGTADAKPRCDDSKTSTDGTALQLRDAGNAALIRELMTTNRLLLDRLEAVEAKINPAEKLAASASTQAPVTLATPPRKKSQVTPPSTIWFEWFAGEPRLWRVSDVKKRSEARNLIAFMRLFLPGGFQLDLDHPNYRDTVFELGAAAERALFDFLNGHGVAAKGSSSVVKRMRTLHREWKLDVFIRDYKVRLTAGLLVDPSPRDSHDMLALSTA